MISTEEYFAMSRKFEEFSSVFYKFWELGKPVFTDAIATATVAFDEEGDCAAFLFNPDFWNSMNEDERVFLICHEFLHILLGHGTRGRSATNRGVANVAMDIAINETLVRCFGFDRSLLPVVETGSWVDNVFDDEDDVPTNESFEYYYNRLLAKLEQARTDAEEGDDSDDEDSDTDEESNGDSGSDSGDSEDTDEEQDEDGDAESDGESDAGNDGVDGEDEQDGDVTGDANDAGNDTADPGEGQSGSGGGNGPQMFDDHSGLFSDTFNENIRDILNELRDETTDQDREQLRRDLGNQVEPDSQANSPQPTQDNSQQSNATGEFWHAVGNNPATERTGPPPKDKWETVIKKWSQGFREVEETEEQWVHQARRMAALNTDMFIPAEGTEYKREPTMIDVWFFLDTSGSCIRLKDRFFHAAQTLPPHRFKVKLLSFDVQVREVDIANQRIQGGSWTNFAEMERYIQRTIQQTGENYPNAVFVITDGHDNRGGGIRPEHPKRWYWFLTPNHVRHTIPSESHIFMLEDYE